MALHGRMHVWARSGEMELRELGIHSRQNGMVRRGSRGGDAEADLGSFHGTESSGEQIGLAWFYTGVEINRWYSVEGSYVSTPYLHDVVDRRCA